MTSISPVKKTTAVMKTSYLSATTNATPAKNFLTPTKVREIPLESDARYTISYVPGMSEHEIETGKTFEEAKMKVVILSCELERVNTYNYTLVRENEVLRVQANKSEREKDLETKLAIVLAENEKLNQIIEEVYEVYMSTRGTASNQEYQIRITELYQDLEEWKGKYNALEKSTNIVELQNQIRDLQHQKDLISEQLARKDRDLEAMRGRIASLEVSSDSQHKVADYENKIRAVLADNEKLNNMLLVKANEVSELRAKLNSQSDSAAKLHDYSAQLNHQIDTHKKSSVNAQKETTERLQSLIGENDKLKQENAGLRAQLASNHDNEAQSRILHEEIQRLNIILHEKDREIAAIQGNSAQSYEQKAAIERLSLKIQELIQQNDGLNKLADAKSLENSGLYNKIRELESKSHQSDESTIRIRLVSEEKEKLREQLEQKNREIQDLYHRCSELNQSTLIVSEYKEKLVLLTQDNERLNGMIHAKMEESDNLKRQLLSSESTRGDTSSYEEKIRVLLSENQRLTELHRSQASEVDNLRVSVYQLQANLNHNDELGMKLALVSTENERLLRDIEALKQKVNDDQSHHLQVQINYINSEKQKLETILAERDREIWALKNDHARVIESNVAEHHRATEKMKSAGVDQRRKIDELEGRISQLVGLETKVNYLSIEVEKLHKEVIERENHIQIISQTLAERERELSDARFRLQSVEGQRQHEIEEIRTRIQIELESKFARIREELEIQIRQLIAEKKELENKDSYVAVEFERLQVLIKDIKVELDDWKRRYYQLQSSNDEEVEELRRQFEGLKLMTMQAKDMQHKFAAERTAYETQILQMSQMISDLEHQVQIISTENGRMTELSLQRLKMIEELKANSNEDAHRLEILELRNQLELLKSNSYDVKQLALQYSSEKAAFQSKITELSELITTYKGDISELRSLLEKRKTDVESLNKQNEELRKMCEKLNAQVRTGSTGGVKAETVEVMQLKITELEIAKSEFQRQAERNFVELSRKNRELVDKIQECDVLNLKYEEALANLQALNNQTFTRLSMRK